jgi:hypothetical protein
MGTGKMVPAMAKVSTLGRREINTKINSRTANAMAKESWFLMVDQNTKALGSTARRAARASFFIPMATKYTANLKTTNPSRLSVT